MAALTGRALIASRCAKFFKNGDFVNLGIGVPLLCVNYLPEGVNLWLEAEIGTVGSGATPPWDSVDIDVIDAGGQPASIITGGSVYDHEMSFAFIRGGHIDATVLGTLRSRHGRRHGPVRRRQEDHRSDGPLRKERQIEDPEKMHPAPDGREMRHRHRHRTVLL